MVRFHLPIHAMVMIGSREYCHVGGGKFIGQENPVIIEGSVPEASDNGWPTSIEIEELPDCGALRWRVILDADPGEVHRHAVLKSSPSAP
jgi:hypothetical protein